MKTSVAFIAYFFAGAAVAQPTSAHEIVQRLHSAGYVDVRDLDFEDGLWEAEARRAFGLWGDVVVDPATGIIYDARARRPLLARAAVREALQRQGYTVVGELERDGAIWNAETWDHEHGHAVELQVSGYDGQILSAQPDQ